jgi:pyruvate dehydrogenase phosphatase
MVSVSHYQANEQMEDRYALLPRPPAAPAAEGGPAGCGMLVAAVMDGHGGWQVSEHARRTLPDAIVRELDHAASPRDPQQVARAYQRVDRAFVDAVRGAYALGFGDVARVGACAISAVVTPDFVVVANAGDCRAVLGRVWRGPAGDGGGGGGGGGGGEVFVTATPLSHDHNARMPREATKLAVAHPGEADIVVCRSPTACYVKGRLQPTRALGDAYLKFSEFNGPPGSGGRVWGRHIPPPYTPPYITSTPEVRGAPGAR